MARSHRLGFGSPFLHAQTLKSQRLYESEAFNMPNQSASAFLITRPIQYLNAINIPHANSRRTLLIVDTFKGANSLRKKAALPGSSWTSVRMFDSVHDAMVWVREHKDCFTDFFTFSDFGLRLCMMLGRLKPLRIHVYEEGAGTYAREEFRLGSIRSIASILSSGKIKSFRHMGDCRFVDTIFVNHVELYKTLFPSCNKVVRSFSVPLLEHLMVNSDVPSVVHILPKNSATRDALLYLSDWTVNDEVLNILATHPLHVSLAKPHPAYMGSFGFNDDFDFVVEPEVLGEIIIAQLANCFRSLTVVHECSSAVLNCRLAGIAFEEINLGSSERELDSKFKAIEMAVEKVTMRELIEHSTQKNHQVSNEDRSRTL